MPAKAAAKGARKTSKGPVTAKASAKGGKATRKAAAKAPKRSPAKAGAAGQATGTFVRSGTGGKGEGDAAVQAWIAKVQPAHQKLLRDLDALVTKAMPGAVKAVKWNSPMYGLPGKGWIVHLGAFKAHVAIGFFSGSLLKPAIEAGDAETMRRFKITGPQDFDAAKFTSWVKQASELPGWGNV